MTAILAAMDDVQIRPAGAGDRAPFLELQREAQQLHHQARPDVFRPADQLRLGASAWAELLGREGVVVWVACRGAEVVGALQAERQERAQTAITPAQVIVYVQQVTVRAGARGRGIGSALMRAVVAWARGSGAARVELDVWAFNAAARRLYGRLGFEPLVERMGLALR